MGKNIIEYSFSTNKKNLRQKGGGKKMSKEIYKYKERKGDDSSSALVKTQKLVWTDELHHQFLKAIDPSGRPVENVDPNKILELMTAPGLTRANIASHLQELLPQFARQQKVQPNCTLLQARCEVHLVTLSSHGHKKQSCFGTGDAIPS